MVNAEYAVAVTSDNFAEIFAAMDDTYMQARAADVRDISNRIIQNLTQSGKEEKASDEKVIICADNLVPSETVSLDKEKVLAFVTSHGSSNSHTAILARNMNIPAVIGAGDAFLDEISDGMLAIVDGFTGTIYVDPDEETLEKYQKLQEEDERKKRLLQELKGKENVTLDGTKINIYANIGGIDNVGAVLLNEPAESGCSGVNSCILENPITRPRKNSSRHTVRCLKAWQKRRLSSVHWISGRTSRPIILNSAKRKIRHLAIVPSVSALPVRRYSKPSFGHCTGPRHMEISVLCSR